MTAVKSDRDRGHFGSWLRQQRTAKFGNVPEAVQAMQREIGYGIAPSVWAELESGTRRPSKEQRERLTAYFGAAPADESVSDQVDAIREQTAALLELVAEVRAMREAQQGHADGLATILGLLAGRLGVQTPELVGRSKRSGS